MSIRWFYLLILFPNDQLVSQATNIEYRQAIIAPSDPVLSPSYHWETPRTNLYGSVIKSAQGYEMFYQCGNALRVGYAHSEDGINWHKPLVNKTWLKAPADKILIAPDEKETSNNNALGTTTMTNLVAGCHMPSVIHEPNSREPYKMFAFGDGGYRTYSSENGKYFTDNAEEPAIALLTYKNPTTEKVWCSDVAPCFKDKEGYTAMVKTYEVDDEGRTRRCVGKSTSNDFKQWSETKTLWIPSKDEDRIAQARGYHWADFYGLCPFQYGDGYLGLLWLFEIDHELPNGTNLGKIEIFLAYSPDGDSWRRISDKPLIPWDLNFGASGGMITTPGAPVFEDTEIKLYYSDSNYEHGMYERDYTKEVEDPTWVTRCARLPKERLVAACSNSGSLQLGPMQLQGSKIRVNLAAKDGWLRLDYYTNEALSATQLIENIDDTDYFLELPVQGETTLALTFNQAALYALEVVNDG
jgi:hypothetical protein